MNRLWSVVVVTASVIALYVLIITLATQPTWLDGVPFVGGGR